MSDLLAPVVSITRTQRGRFFWAAWWSAPPARLPFRRPDASNGGARSHEEAKHEAELSAGSSLTEIEPLWARACIRTMRGQPPFTPRELAAASGRPIARRDGAPPPASLWAILGVEPDASVLEIKRAFRQRALTTHPDQGGDPAAFRTLHGAYERALARRGRKR